MLTSRTHAVCNTETVITRTISYSKVLVLRDPISNLVLWEHRQMSVN